MCVRIAAILPEPEIKITKENYATNYSAYNNAYPKQLTLFALLVLRNFERFCSPHSTELILLEFA